MDSDSRSMSADMKKQAPTTNARRFSRAEIGAKDGPHIRNKTSNKLLARDRNGFVIDPSASRQVDVGGTRMHDEAVLTTGGGDVIEAGRGFLTPWSTTCASKARTNLHLATKARRERRCRAPSGPTTNGCAKPTSALASTQK